MGRSKGRLGILMGGGPAPGINSAIGAAAIEAINSGFDVVGIYDGYKHLMEGRIDVARQLTIPEVSRIHFEGGSVLRTARANPTKSPESLRQTVQSLERLGVSYLVTIGGDDTAFAASEVARTASGALRVAHIPKTIDNDLPLPGNMPTFGFETARHLGTELVRNLMEDARTTNRWYLVTAMGRKAGHLALGIGKASGATLTIIPEEFPSERIGLADVCDVLEAAMIKRRALGSEHGLAIIAEGIAEKFRLEELEKMPGVEVATDQYGHIRLAEIPLEKILKREIERRFAEQGEEIRIVYRNIGYELRSAPPIPFDIDYTRTLGYAAVRALISDQEDSLPQGGGLVCLKDGRTSVLPFSELRDPATGRTKIRVVDVLSESYHVARQYMIRLEKSDLADSQLLDKMAAAARMTPEDFRQRYASVVESVQDVGLASTPK